MQKEEQAPHHCLVQHLGQSKPGNLLPGQLMCGLCAEGSRNQTWGMAGAAAIVQWVKSSLTQV